MRSSSRRLTTVESVPKEHAAYGGPGRNALIKKANHLISLIPDRAAMLTNDEAHNGNDEMYGESLAPMLFELMSGPWACFHSKMTPAPVLLDIGGGCGLFAAMAIDFGVVYGAISVEMHQGRIDRTKAMLASAQCPSAVKHNLKLVARKFAATQSALHEGWKEEDRRIVTEADLIYIANTKFEPSNNESIQRVLSKYCRPYAIVVALEPLPQLQRVGRQARFKTTAGQVMSWTPVPHEYYVYWMDAPPMCMPVDRASRPFRELLGIVSAAGPPPQVVEAIRQVEHGGGVPLSAVLTSLSTPTTTTSVAASRRKAPLIREDDDSSDEPPVMSAGKRPRFVAPNENGNGDVDEEDEDDDDDDDDAEGEDAASENLDDFIEADLNADDEPHEAPPSPKRVITPSLPELDWKSTTDFSRPDQPPFSQGAEPVTPNVADIEEPADAEYLAQFM